MRLPADFAQLSVPEQLLVAVDRERVDRHLTPFPGLSSTLDQNATKGATASRLPVNPGPPYSSVMTEWIGAIANGLDADYEWMYNDGPNSGTPGCNKRQTSGCWADRQILLERFGAHPTLGASFDPMGDTSSGDVGGSSLAAILAGTARVVGPYAYTWKQALADMSRGTLQPLREVPTSESDSGISDPVHNVPPTPDYPKECSGTGIDNSSRCVGTVLAAINAARAKEHVRPMVLPAGFSSLSIPEQLFVAINLERVDRGLPPFVGLTAPLNRNAKVGATQANDPPPPGRGYLLDDAVWAGGTANGLDAVYGWMYDDGANSGNLDCRHRGAPGCWGHRKDILDDFGSSSHLVMGAAVEPTGDTHAGNFGGTSMAVTMAVATTRPSSYTYTWAQALAAMPGGHA
jgi:hypothetical protein